MPLVATGFGDRDTGGGAFVVNPDGAERLDWLASTGLAVAPAGDRLARLVRGDEADAAAGSELLIYDTAGVLRYARVDELGDPHDVVWRDATALVAAATGANRLLVLDDAGRVADRWIAPTGTGDAWHLNCLHLDAGRLVACAFGRFADHRGWSRRDADDADGIVFDVATGATLVDGLFRPHNPRRLPDGSWLICDSGRGTVVRRDGTTGATLDTADAGGFTRGLAVDGDLVYAGVNPSRTAAGGSAATARVVALRLSDLAEQWSATLPCREVYDLAVVPEPLVDGLRRGFRTNPARTADDDQLALFRAVGVEPVRLWATGDALPREACRTRVTVDGAPAAVPAPYGDTGATAVEVRWTVENFGGAVLTSGGRHPVWLSWRWYATANADTPIAEGPRIPFGAPLPPGASTSGTVAVPVPGRPRPRRRPARPRSSCASPSCRRASAGSTTSTRRTAGRPRSRPPDRERPVRPSPATAAPP